MVGWTFDPNMAQGGTLLATPAGTLTIMKFRAVSTTITSALMHFTAGGSMLTGTYAGLFTAAGAFLPTSQSADLSASWASGGVKPIPFGVPQTVIAGNMYYFGFFIATSVTMPTITRALNSSSAITNIGLNAPNFRYATTADAALTTTMPGTLGAQTGSATAFWVGFS